MPRLLTTAARGALGLLTLCGCDDETAAPEPTQSITLTFDLRVGDRAVRCGERYELGSTATAWEPVDARFYVSRVELLHADGTAEPLTLDTRAPWQASGVALLDFEDGAGACTAGGPGTNAVVTGTVREGTYSGVRFEIGVPEALNHQAFDAAPSPLNLSSLAWGWLAGYRFLRIDGRTGAGTWELHLGSTACDGTPPDAVTCERANRPSVTLASFDASVQRIVVDVAQLFADTDLATRAGGSVGCASEADDGDCAGVWPHLGLDLATGAATGGQDAVRAE